MELIEGGRRVRSSAWPDWRIPRQPALAELLGLLNFACLKINKSEPW
jgi:hypothetical protein